MFYDKQQKASNENATTVWAKVAQGTCGTVFHAWENGRARCHAARTHRMAKFFRSSRPPNACAFCAAAVAGTAAAEPEPWVRPAYLFGTGEGLNGCCGGAGLHRSNCSKYRTAKSCGAKAVPAKYGYRAARSLLEAVAESSSDATEAQAWS